MSQSIRVQVRFSEQTPYGEYNDALYYTETEYANISQSEIDTEKANRVANYISLVSNPTVPTEPTKEQLEAEKAALLEQIAQIDAKISEKS